MRFFVPVIIGLFACAVPSLATTIQWSVNPNHESYRPGDTVVVSLQAKIPSRWHLYGNPLGPGIGKALKLSVRGAEHIRWTGLLKTKATRLRQDEKEWVWAYEKEAHFFLEGILDTGSPAYINGTIVVDGLMCRNSCVPVTASIPFVIRVGKRDDRPSFAAMPRLATFLATAKPMPWTAPSRTVAPVEPSPSLAVIDLKNLTATPDTAPAPDVTPQWSYVPVEVTARLTFLWALLFALIAGVILNAMPCVLPVLGIKVLALAKEASGNRRNAIAHSLMFSAGMIAVFMVLASGAAFAGLSWGQHFQNPFVLAGIIGVIVFFAMGMFDLYTILIPGAVGSMAHAARGKGYAGDFASGFFAAILATPCSGPFLGATLAWTLTQSALVIYLVFTMLGIGMALPYVLLATNRTIARFIPQPGAWMDDFKRIMGFLLLGFAVYLMIGLPRDMQIPTVGACLGLAIAVMAFSRIAPFGSSLLRTVIAGGVALALAGAGIAICFGYVYPNFSEKGASLARNDSSKVVWEPFAPQKLIDAHRAQRNVVVDFTANWCMNCHYNTIAVLHANRVENLLKKKQATLLLVDLTGPNPHGEKLLHSLGSRSIPFLAIFPGNNAQRPTIMRDMLSVDAVTRALEQLP